MTEYSLTHHGDMIYHEIHEKGLVYIKNAVFLRIDIGMLVRFALTNQHRKSRLGPREEKIDYTRLVKISAAIPQHPD